MEQVGLQEGIRRGIEAARSHVQAPAATVIALALVTEGVERIVLVRIALREFGVRIAIGAVAIGRLGVSIGVDEERNAVVHVVAIGVGRRRSTVGCIGHCQTVASRVIGVVLGGDGAAVVVLLLLAQLVANALIGEAGRLGRLVRVGLGL